MSSFSNCRTASTYRPRCPLPFETLNSFSVTEQLIRISMASSTAGASSGMCPSGIGLDPVSSIYSSSMYAGRDTSESCSLNDGGLPKELQFLVHNVQGNYTWQL